MNQKERFRAYEEKSNKNPFKYQGGNILWFVITMLEFNGLHDGFAVIIRRKIYKLKNFKLKFKEKRKRKFINFVSLAVTLKITSSAF